MMQVKSAPLALLAILVLAILLRVIFFTGYHDFDDKEYIVRAVELSRGDLTLPDSHWAARLGMVGPTALFYRAFGVTPASTVAWPFLCSVLSVSAAFVLGRRLYDARTGLIAALLLAVFPLDVLFASMLYPTAPTILLAGAGLCLFLIAEREQSPMLYLASGLAVGAAGVVHEAALMVLAFYPVYVVVIARPARGHAMAAAGIFIALAVDPVIHGLMGDPWVRMSVVNHTKVFQGTSTHTTYSGLSWPWLTEGIVRPFVERTFGIFAWLLAPVVALRLWKPREPNDLALALIVAAGYLWIVYGTVSPFAYAPLWRLPRYLAPLVIPALLLLGHELATQIGARARVVVLSALALTSMGCLMLDSGSALPPYRELRSVLARERPAMVVVEPPHYIPLLFVEGFAPSYTVSEFGGDVPHAAVLVVGSAAARARLETLPGVVLLARITPPETLYVRLLRSRWILAILRFTRPGARFSEYEQKTAPWEIRVYRVP